MLPTNETALLGKEDIHETDRLVKLKQDIKSGTLTADDWCKLSIEASHPVFGTADNRIVLPSTKNIILAPEKTFKNTFAMRLLLGLSCGVATFPQLSVPQAQSVLYIHGELSPPEIVERTKAAVAGLSGSNFYQSRNPDVNVCTPRGKRH